MKYVSAFLAEHMGGIRMLKYDIYTTLMNYIPLLACIVVIYNVFKNNYLKALIKLFVIVTTLVYLYLQFRWIIMDFERLVLLENLWSAVELMMMISILLILSNKQKN